MLSALESASIIIASILGALAFLLYLRRSWPVGTRHKNNDMIGWQLGFIGTTYAVIIAFMLSDVWSDYQAAETNAQLEANALVSLYRVSSGLGTNQTTAVQSLSRDYSNAMINEEWPAMMKGKLDTRGSQIVDRLWKAAMSSETHTPQQQACLNHALTDLTSLTEHRRVRQLQSQSSLPEVFWLVLIVGEVLTVAYTCVFDIQDPRMHILQVVGVTFLISLVLVTIADVDSPYGGALHIQPTGFVLASETMNGGSQ